MLDDAASSPGTDQPAQTTKSLSNCRICRNDSNSHIRSETEGPLWVSQNQIHTHTHAKPHRYIRRKTREKKQAPTNRVLKADRKSAKTKKTNINDENTRQGYQHPTSQRVESTRSTPDQRLHSEASIKSMLRSFTRPAL